MKFKRNISLILLFVTLFFLINGVSAEDLSNNTLSLDNSNLPVEDECIELNEVCSTIESDTVSEEGLCSSNDLNTLSDDEGQVIFVGHNNKTQFGKGTEEDPFFNFSLACDNVSNHEKVTVKIFEGNYTLGSILTFDTKNLAIIGINGSVVIKNVFNYDKINKGETAAESFALTSTDGTFSMTNIIFDASGRDVAYYRDDNNRKSWFEPIHGILNSATYINCSFIGYVKNNRLPGANYNCTFLNCYFDINNEYKTLFVERTDTILEAGFIQNTYHIFEYCHFNMHGCVLTNFVTLPTIVSVNNSWLGQNDVSKFNNAKYVYDPRISTDETISGWSAETNRYVQFSIYENYLGNNTWEIIGKLTWNGTNDQDGMENFQPMTVELKSNTGEIASTATLVNGTFRTIYTSSASTYHIETKLDSEDNQELDFTLVNINVTAQPIKYGEDQNITINFSQPINSTIVITVNNRPYSVKVNESAVVTYTIKDVNLTKGEYNVTVTLNDTVNHIYGSNSTTLSVSKVSTYTFNPVVPSEAKIGDTVNINVELPEDVTGNVTVYVNNNPITQQASKNTVIPITGLVAGNNEIIVFYEGNDKYENKTSDKQYITADKVSDYSFDVILPSNVKVGDNTSITIKLPNDANGNALVYVGSQDSITVPVSGESTVVPVSGLVAGNNTVKVVFSDDKYAEKTVIKNITVEKVPVEITNNTIVVNAPSDSATPTVSLNIPGATGKLTVIINNKTFTETLKNGTATVTIKDVPAGTYNATVIYSGDDTFNQITTTAMITVSEPKKQDNNNNGGKTNKVTKTATKIVAKKKTFKAKKKVKKYTITLKTKAGKSVKKVWVTLKIKGKKLLKAKTNAKGKATFKIKKLTKKGKYTATIKFKGNKNYKASSKKVKITIKK